MASNKLSKEELKIVDEDGLYFEQHNEKNKRC